MDMGWLKCMLQLWDITLQLVFENVPDFLLFCSPFSLFKCNLAVPLCLTWLVPKCKEESKLVMASNSGKVSQNTQNNTHFFHELLLRSVLKHCISSKPWQEVTCILKIFFLVYKISLCNCTMDLEGHYFIPVYSCICLEWQINLKCER